jgi:hypothetical protein
MFISAVLRVLKIWFEANNGHVTAESKTARLQLIKDHFVATVKPQLGPHSYSDFEKRELNNAYLLAYQTYEYNLDDFAKVYSHFGNDFKKSLEFLKTLKDSKAPDQDLKAFAAQL